MIKSDVFTNKEVFNKRVSYLTDCGCTIMIRYEKNYYFDDGVISHLYVLVWEE